MAIPVALPGSTSPQLEQEPPQRMCFQLSLPFKCKRPCSMPFSTSMRDMMVPSTDLWILALQKSMTTNLGSSLVSLSVASQVDWSRYIPVPLLKKFIHYARTAANVMPILVSSILLWIRELPCVDQHDLTIGNWFGEKIPPNIRIIDASTVVMGEAVLNPCSYNHQVRPILVRIGQRATWVPCVTIHCNHSHAISWG